MMKDRHTIVTNTMLAAYSEFLSVSFINIFITIGCIGKWES